jgi:hypothetical protein
MGLKNNKECNFDHDLTWFLAHGYMVFLYISKPQQIACYHMNKSKYPIEILFFN